MADTINPNTIFLDTETSGTPKNSFGPIFFSNGKYKPRSIQESMRDFADVDFDQVGIKIGKEKTKHFQIEPGTKGRVAGQVSNDVTGYEVINGIRIPVKQYVTQDMSEGALLDFLSQNGKLKKSQIRGFSNSVGQKLIRRSLSTNVETTLGDGTIINTSKWSFMNHGWTIDQRLGGINKVESLLGSKDYGHLGIDVKKVSAQEYKSGTGSLYDEIGRMLKIGTKDNPAQLHVQNPGFDIEALRAVIARSGNTSLLKEFEGAVANGLLEVRAVEHEWQQIVYRLVKENPEMRSAFKIKWTPSAFRETGGRSGMTAGTFEEFVYSTNKWSAQHISNVFSFHPAIKNVLPNGVEAHLASLDTELTRAQSAEVFSDLLKHAREISKNPNLSLSELTKMKGDSKILTKAFEALVKEHSGSSMVSPANQVKSILSSKIEAPARRIANLEKPLGASYTQAVNKLTHGSIGIKYGIPGIIAAAALYGVYGLGGDERSVSFLDRLPAFGNLMTKVFNKQSRHGTINDSANKRTHLIKTLAEDIGVPLLGLYTTGYIAAKSKPSLFGTGTKPINTLGDATNSFFRTVLYGAKKMEAAVPTTKILRLSDLSNYLFSDRSYGQLPNGAWRRKNFNVISNIEGKTFIRDRFSHGVNYENLIEAAEITNPDNADLLKQWLLPKKVDAGVTKRVAGISIDSKGRAVIFGEEYGTTEEGISKLLNGESGSLRNRMKEGITIDAKISITDVRHKSLFAYGEARKKLSANSFTYHNMQRELVERGYTWKNTIEDVMKLRGLKADPETLAYYEEQLKLRLEIGAKGVGESVNRMFNDMEKLSRQTTSVINIKSLEGKSKWTLSNLKSLTKFWSPVAQSYTTEGMNNFLERPFEALGTDTKKLYALADSLKKSDNIFKKVAGKTLSAISAPHLGLPAYSFRGGMAGYLGEFAIKRALPAFAAYEGLRFVDHALGILSPNGRGPLTTIPIKAYEGAALLYSKISDLTGMTALAKKQESVAPGSTGLGIFAAAASLASTAHMAEMLINHGPREVIKPIERFSKGLLASHPNISSLFQRGTHSGVFASRTIAEKAISWGITNPKKALFAIGMLPALPFLPGFLGSNKSYAERKAEFQGKKEVAIRKNRGWLLSTSPIQGNKISHFRENALHLIERDWENRGVVWPSYWKRFLHNATGGLYGRYMLEDYHSKDQPIYQSAPYGANIPVIGPIFSATIGKLIKPTIDYHKFGENYGGDGISGAVMRNLTNTNTRSLSAFGTGRNGFGAGANVSRLTTDQLAQHIGLSSENSMFSLSNKFSKSLHDFIGFRGFGYEAARSAITGVKSPDEFVPYAQSASEFYNPAQQMWQYQAGDISLIGGEFLRRILQYPDKKWTVNNLPNELAGVSWIPQGGSDVGKTSKRDLTHGTTFDKVPMGWLYGTRRGWEELHPEVKGLDLEEYPDQIKLDVLAHAAPYSSQFNDMAKRVSWMARENKLNPEQEQKYYNTLQQVGEMKDQLYATENESGYSVDTATVKGRITSVDDQGRFSLDTHGDKTFRLAGVSLDEQDIRAKLLKEHEFSSSDELSEAMQNTMARTRQTMQRVLHKGANVSLQVPTMSQMVDSNEIEAQIGSLNTILLGQGAGYVNTGNLSKYNIYQQLHGVPGKMIGKFWSSMTEGESFWINKLHPKRDYLSHYKYSNVYNREVKLWNHPIEQIFKPMVASTFHKFGVDLIPQFTINRRRNQEYWDTLKYIKGKMLEVRTGDPAYRDMWRSTMLGADPIRGDKQSLLQAIPENERAWFDRFANEPDPKKRGQILKLIPAAQRRIYTGIWAKQQHAGNLGHSKSEEEYWTEMAETEGFGKTKREESQWRAETDGQVKYADWKRAKHLEEYAKTHYIPGADSDIWKDDVDIDSVELLSLRADGENVEDYGFFEDKIRISAFDSRANMVAMQLKSQVLTMSGNVGSVLPYVSSSYDAKDAQTSPTAAINPLMQNTIVTNHYERLLKKNYTRYAAEMLDDVVMLALRR